jgi:hypothetical protein
MAYFELLPENLLGRIYENSSLHNSLYISVAPWLQPFRSRVVLKSSSKIDLKSNNYRRNLNFFFNIRGSSVVLLLKELNSSRKKDCYRTLDNFFNLHSLCSVFFSFSIKDKPGLFCSSFLFI